MKNRFRKKVNIKRTFSTKVFDGFLNRNAFVHKIVCGVHGDQRKEFEDDGIDKRKNEGICTNESIYARVIFGQWRFNRNRIIINYGKTKNFANVPPMLFTMHSKYCPWTAAQVRRLVASATAGYSRIRVSGLEMTFDITGVGIDRIEQLLHHRAKRGSGLQNRYGRTIYIGSPRSAWQARIYEKNKKKNVVRIEFIFRRPFLASHGINEVEDVLLLTKINIWKLLSFRQFSRRSAVSATQGYEPTWRNMICDWVRWKRPIHRLPEFLRASRIDPTRILRKTSLQRRLESMQRHFIW